jgi:O-antigen ligase
MSDVASNMMADAGSTGLSSPDVQGSRAATIIAWGVLLTLLVAPLTLGNYIGDVAILLGLASLFAVSREGYRVVLRMPHIWLLIGAFVLLGIAAVAVGRFSADSLVVFDFSTLLLAIPICGVFSHARILRANVTLPLLALLGTLVACSVACAQLIFLHDPRPGGWMFNPIYFADLAITLGFIAAAGVLDRVSKWWPVFVLGPILGVSAGILSGTRTSLIVAGAELVLFAVVGLRRRDRMAAAVLLSVAVLLACMFLMAPAVGLGRVLDLGQVLQGSTPNDGINDASVGYRVDQYRAAVRAFADAPFFGHGWRHTIQSALNYMPPAARQAAIAGGWGHIHNELLNMSVGMGVLGILAWALMMAYPPVALLWARGRGGLSSATTYMVLVPWLGILLGGLTDVLFRSELTKSFYPFIPNAILMLTWRPERVVTP